MLELCRDLVAHKGHANAALLTAIRASDAATADPELRQLLDHILLANRFWLLSILRRPFVREDESPSPLSFGRRAQGPVRQVASEAWGRPSGHRLHSLADDPPGGCMA